MRIFWRIKQSHQAFFIFCLLDPRKVKKVKNHYFLYSFHLTDKCNRNIISPWLFFLQILLVYMLILCKYRKCNDFRLFWLFGVPKDKNSKMVNGTVWYVKRCAFKRRFQKYVTLINIFIRSRVMAETPKLKKTGFWFFDHKRVNS